LDFFFSHKELVLSKWIKSSKFLKIVYAFNSPQVKTIELKLTPMMKVRGVFNKIERSYWKGMVALTLPFLSLAEDDVLSQGLETIDKNAEKGLSMGVKALLWLWLALLVGSIFAGIIKGWQAKKEAEQQRQEGWGAFFKGLAAPVVFVWGLSALFVVLLLLLGINVKDAFAQLFNKAVSG
jgi:hypothetical protein